MAQTIRLFGFQIESPEDAAESQQRSFVQRENDDGAVLLNYMNAFTGAYASYVDLDGSIRSENQLIDKYREIANQPEVDFAVEEITNEAIVADEMKAPVQLNLDELTDVNDQIKKKISSAFEYVMSLLYFKNRGHDIFRRWYIDGRLYYHIMIDEKKPHEGITELRYINPKNLKKIREIRNDPSMNVGSSAGAVLYKNADTSEYYIYTEIVADGQGQTNLVNSSVRSIKIAPHSIAMSNSGLYDSRTNMVLSYLHTAIRPANNLRLLEDSIVVYRLSRAPERRIFYIDVGNLPKTRSEQYMNQIMHKYKNKLVYDASTGDVRDDRRFMALTEDYWIPRRDGSRGTQIDTLPGGQNLGNIEDVEYMLDKLFRSLHVPLSRFQSEGADVFGNTGTITRDELRFSKFVIRLRQRFTMLFDDLLGKQLALTQVMSLDDWETIKTKVHYDFLKENYFTELYENQVLTDRINLATSMSQFMGTLFSQKTIFKKALKMTDEEIEEERKQIQYELENGIIKMPMDDNGDGRADNTGGPDGNPFVQSNQQQGLTSGASARTAGPASSAVETQQTTVSPNADTAGAVTESMDPDIKRALLALMESLSANKGSDALSQLLESRRG